ncbi:MAG: hypothetical protein ACI865_002901 [Flavobacteriaceae bacterium]|jgi:hypothetical protein
MRVLIILLFIPFMGFTQAPNQFKYQSIARDLAGSVLNTAPIGLRISIRNLSSSGTIVYQETHATTTNEFGLFTLSIGGGTPVSGTMALVDWGAGSKYVEIEADLSGGTTYDVFGTTELLSVPYAIHANSAGAPILPNGTSAGNTTYWDGSSWVVSSANLYNNGSRIGLGTSAPDQRLDIKGHMTISLDSVYMIDNRQVLSTRGNTNLFVGDSAGIAGSIGFKNVFVGFKSGVSNTVGSQNTFVGAETGITNLNGIMNSFFGRRAGFQVFDGIENTFIGAYAGQSTTSGGHNSFLGVTTGNANTTGSENTFIGAHAGYFNGSGSYNTLLGNFSGVSNTDGSYNTLVGFESDVLSSSYTNAGAFGYGAIVNGSNSIVIGNTSVTSIGGQVGWSIFSDRRLKTGFRQNELGLDFINGLETVSYEYKADGQKGIRYSGLIAQDVEILLDNLGADFSGLVRPKNNQDYYSIRYSEFVIPLIKAVQEQAAEIATLQDKNKGLELRLSNLESIVSTLIEINK